MILRTAATNADDDGEELLALAGHADALRRAREHRDAQLLLQEPHRLGERRLGDEAPAGRLADRAVCRHRVGILELLKCHGGIIPYFRLPQLGVPGECGDVLPADRPLPRLE